jgi:hypothetical protein
MADTRGKELVIIVSRIGLLNQLSEEPDGFPWGK